MNPYLGKIVYIVLRLKKRKKVKGSCVEGKRDELQSSRPLRTNSHNYSLSHITDHHCDMDMLTMKHGARQSTVTFALIHCNV